MQKIILKTKPFQETLNSGCCGPASLKIVLDRYGINKSERELSVLCNKKKQLGVDDKAIKSAAESFGFKVKIEDFSDFQSIAVWLKKGVPVIVDWFSRGRSSCSDQAVSDGHYSVVAGLDDKFIYLQDPEIGKIRKVGREDFMTVWFDFRGKYIKSNELIIRQIIAIYR